MLYEAHGLLEELAEAQLTGERKAYVEHVASAPLLIIDDLGMRKLPSTAAEDLLKIHHAPLRACIDAADVESACRRLGEAARRHRGGDRDARSLAAPRARPQVRAAELANEATRRLAGLTDHELHERVLEQLAGFDLSTEGRRTR